MIPFACNPSTNQTLCDVLTYLTMNTQYLASMGFEAAMAHIYAKMIFNIVALVILGIIIGITIYLAITEDSEIFLVTIVFLLISLVPIYKVVVFSIAPEWYAIESIIHLF